MRGCSERSALELQVAKEIPIIYDGGALVLALCWLVLIRVTYRIYVLKIFFYTSYPQVVFFLVCMFGSAK